MSLFAGKPFLLGGFIICCKDWLLLKLHVLEVRYTVVGSLTIHAVSSCKRNHLADCEGSTICAIRTKDTIAKQQGNVIKLEHNQFVTTNRTAQVELRITLEAFGSDHKQQIMEALDQGGYKPKIVRTSL